MLIVAAPSGTTTTWDLQVAVLPLAEAPIALRTRKPGDAAWSTWLTGSANTLANNTFGGAFRPGLNAMGQYSKDPHVDGAIAVLPSLVDSTTQFRLTHRGVTMVLNANAFSDQGLVTAGQWAAQPREVGEWKPYRDFPPAARGAYHLPAIEFADVPQTSDQLVAKCSGAGQWDARKGAYMPMRFENPAHQYTASGYEYSQVSNGQTYGRSGAAVMLTGPVTGGPDPDQDDRTTLVWLDKDPVWTPTHTPQVITTAGPVNQNMGCLFFEGLDVKATMLIKTRQGLEIVPTEDSPLASAVTEPPPCDEAAIKMAHAISRDLPLVYEHKYNSLNALLPLIKSVASAVAPVVLPWLGGKLKGWLGME